MNELSEIAINRHQATVRPFLENKLFSSEAGSALFLEFFCLLASEYMFDNDVADRTLNGNMTLQELEEWVLPVFRDDDPVPKIAFKVLLLSEQFSAMDRQSTFNQLLEVFENPLAWAIFQARLRVDGWYSEIVDPLNAKTAANTISIATSEKATLEQKVKLFFEYWDKFRPFKSSQFRFWTDNPTQYDFEEGTEYTFFSDDGRLDLEGIVARELEQLNSDLKLDKIGTFDAIKYKVAALVVEKDLWSTSGHAALMEDVQVAFDEVYVQKIAVRPAFSTPQKSAGSSSSSSDRFFSPTNVAISTPALVQLVGKKRNMDFSEEENEAQEDIEQAAESPKVVPRYRLRNRDVGEVPASTNSAYRPR